MDLWRGYFAEPQSSTGPVPGKLFKEVTAAHVGCHCFNTGCACFPWSGSSRLGLSFVSPFDVRRCSPHRRPVREDGSGSVSAQLVAKSARWSNGRWQRGSSLRTGATSSTVSFRGSFLTTGATSKRSIARCIALVQVQDADGPRRRRWRCEERRRTLGRGEHAG